MGKDNHAQFTSTVSVTLSNGLASGTLKGTWTTKKMRIKRNERSWRTYKLRYLHFYMKFDMGSSEDIDGKWKYDWQVIVDEKYKTKKPGRGYKQVKSRMIHGFHTGKPNCWRKGKMTKCLLPAGTVSFEGEGQKNAPDPLTNLVGQKRRVKTKITTGKSG